MRLQVLLGLTGRQAFTERLMKTNVKALMYLASLGALLWFKNKCHLVHILFCRGIIPTFAPRSNVRPEGGFAFPGNAELRLPFYPYSRHDGEGFSVPQFLKM